MKKNNSHEKELIKILCEITDHNLMQKFLDDLLSKSEFSDIKTRWQIIKQLDSGITQRKISKDLKVSISKITRGSLELKNKKGGFRQILNQQK